MNDHAPPPLSPAALDLLDAYVAAACKYNYSPRAGLAAALRAAAELPYEVPAYIRGDDYMYYIKGVESERQRNIAIANELNPQP